MTGDQLTVDERIDAALERAQRLRDQADALRAAPLQVGPLDGPDAQVRAALTKRDWGAAGNEPVQVRP